MAHASVADDVDNHVGAEDLSVLSCYSKDAADVINAIGIHMENWCINGLCDISAIKTGSGLMRSGSKTNLVVGYNVNRSSDSVVLKVLHLHRLVNYTLTGKGCVSV